MDRAYLHASISLSLQVAELSILGQLIFERMFPHADHQGRLPGHAKKIRALVIPLIETSSKEVDEQLRQMHDAGLIVWYVVGGEKYIQLVSWWKFQDRRFAHASKHPAPDGWTDRLRFHHPVTHELVEVNWEGRYAEPRKSGRKEPTQDAYVGPLHRPPTQAAYGTEECAPTDTDTDTDKEKDQKSARAKKPHAFIPPTVDEVRAYCTERGNKIDPEHFVDSNEAKGWVIGKNRTPAKDWKAMVRTWERNDNAGPETVVDDGKHGPGGDDRGNGEDHPAVLPAATEAALEEVTPPDKRKFVASILRRNLPPSALARDGSIPLALAERLVNTMRPEAVN